jgi:hypothetical protein
VVTAIIANLDFAATVVLILLSVCLETTTDPKFVKLMTSLHTTIERDGSLDKTASSYDDLLDALRLSLHMYKFD